MEDENTSYQTVGPVSKAMNMMLVFDFETDKFNDANQLFFPISCRWLVEGPDSEAFQSHLGNIRDFMYMTHEGMMMTGTNGTFYTFTFVFRIL